MVPFIERFDQVEACCRKSLRNAGVAYARATNDVDCLAEEMVTVRNPADSAIMFDRSESAGDQAERRGYSRCHGGKPMAWKLIAGLSSERLC